MRRFERRGKRMASDPERSLGNCLNFQRGRPDDYRFKCNRPRKTKLSLVRNGKRPDCNPLGPYHFSAGCIHGSSPLFPRRPSPPDFHVGNSGANSHLIVTCSENTVAAPPKRASRRAATLAKLVPRSVFGVHTAAKNTAAPMRPLQLPLWALD